MIKEKNPGNAIFCDCRWPTIWLWNLLPVIGTSDLVYKLLLIFLLLCLVFIAQVRMYYWHNIQLAKKYFCSLFIKKYFLSVIISTGDKVANMDLSFTSQFLGGCGSFAVKKLHLGDACAAFISISLCILLTFPEQISLLPESVAFGYNLYCSHYLQPLLLSFILWKALCQVSWREHLV